MVARSIFRWRWSRAFAWGGAMLLLASVLAVVSAVQADDAATPDQQHIIVSGNDFGTFLADHQADLAPFFDKNLDDFVKQAVPPVMGLLAWITLFTVLICWGTDVLMSRGFATFFAPAFTKWQRAIIYATGRMALSGVLTVLMSVAILFVLGMSYGGVISIAVAVLFILAAIGAEIAWVIYLYRTNVAVAGMFFLALMAAHFIVAGIIAVPVVKAQAAAMSIDYIDKTITPRMEAEIAQQKQELSVIGAARDQAQAKVSDAQNRIAQAQRDQQDLGRQVEQKKHSDIFVFSQIVKVHAAGDLSSARDQFTEFLARFPSGPVSDLARGQLAQVTAELAAKAVQDKQTAAAEAAAAAAARADLLARAAQGSITLSEMRQALIGKSRTEVGDLLGMPSHTASDTWDYDRQLVLNPLTNERHGLTVYFSEGMVQGVDYYTGKGSLQ